MLINNEVTLYLKILNYNKVTFPCACFDSQKNTFQQNGNYVEDIIKVYILLIDMNDEMVQITSDTDYLFIGKNAPEALIEDGEIANLSELYKKGLKLITYSSKKDYGSKEMRHYYLEAKR